jgi:hypothetical protein
VTTKIAWRCAGPTPVSTAVSTCGAKKATAKYAAVSANDVTTIGRTPAATRVCSPAPVRSRLAMAKSMLPDNIVRKADQPTAGCATWISAPFVAMPCVEKIAPISTNAVAANT